MTALIESAIPLQDKEVSAVKTALAKRYSDSLEYSFVVNPEILGGLRITVDSSRIDLSLSGRLSQVSSALQQ